jgi:hypothetical protein
MLASGQLDINNMKSSINDSLNDNAKTLMAKVDGQFNITNGEVVGNNIKFNTSYTSGAAALVFSLNNGQANSLMKYLFVPAAGQHPLEIELKSYGPLLKLTKEINTDKIEQYLLNKK